MTIKAAQYVRMSTDEQAGSIHIQKATIHSYAAAHDIEVVATYADEGKSGMTLSSRNALQQLLKDVMEPGCEFDVVLVLDVSRWGRFQDVDEAAYHEFHCRKHGVHVLYVAESFSPQPKPLDAIGKHLKRAMASEYSRELGVKVRAGHDRVVRMGCVGAGSPPIGFQRQAVASNGEPKQILKDGERKPLLTDRVRWVPGPAADVALVRRIFALYTETRMNTWQVATRLAKEGSKRRDGSELTRKQVRIVLGETLYCGRFIWRKSSNKKVSELSRFAPDKPEPVRIDGYVESIVDLALWERAAAKLAIGEKKPRIGSVSKGVLRRALIRAVAINPDLHFKDVKSAGLPGRRHFTKHFGGFMAANRCIGRTISSASGVWWENRLSGIRLAIRLYEDLTSLFAVNGIQCAVDRRGRTFVVYRGQLNIRVKIARQLLNSGAWRVQIQPWRDEWLLMMRQDADGSGRDFYLLPPLLSLALGAYIAPTTFDRLIEYRLQDAASLVDRVGRLAEASERGFVFTE
jgi:DNA invertase Pin-like site-specific DNA recombinase